jgi:precorrin-6Y C5,15-methyltransferase (decarboxylating)
MIDVVGIGLDGAEGLNQKVRKLIENATVLAGSRRHLSYFSHYQTEKIFIFFDNLQQGIESLKQFLATHQNVVILASGDPLFFGLGRLLLEKFEPEKIQFHPHLSSVQLAFSSLKIPWQDARLISVHGRNSDELIKLLKQGKEKIAILTDNYHHPGAIARLYLALDLAVDYNFYVCENLGTDTEKITEFSREKVNKLAVLTETDFAKLNVLILIQRESKNNLDLKSLPILGLPDASFLTFRDRHSLITKREIRLAVLGELALQPQQVVWDIGAGTGSVSIEIARLCPTSEIFAIEKTSMGVSLIEKNCHRFQVNNIKIVCGQAPQSLLELPSPHRIFIGGSGGNLKEILDFCAKKITSQGIIVLALATVEHCHIAMDWFTNNSWEYRLLQLQIARSTPVKHLTRFTPLNPVTIITANIL